jgi:predicted RNA binding protein YcfA (HicA-like mRNA interferase family)
MLSRVHNLRIAGHESDEMPPKTLKSIMKQADIP